MKTLQQRNTWNRVIAMIAIAFGLLTIKEGGSVLFGDAIARGSAGNYVAFVLWFNFLAGFAYVVAGLGLWRLQRWAVGLAVAIAVATLLVFAAFGIHVASGGAWEQRTLVAMSLRSLVWIIIAVISTRRLNKRRLGLHVIQDADNSCQRVLAGIQPAIG